jgi:hypothetical protein
MRVLHAETPFLILFRRTSYAAGWLKRGVANLLCKYRQIGSIIEVFVQGIFGSADKAIPVVQAQVIQKGDGYNLEMIGDKGQGEHKNNDGQ